MDFDQKTVSPPAHGIHPPRKLIFFSKVLERLIEKVWRRGSFSRIQEKKGARVSRGRGRGEDKAVTERQRSLGHPRERQEDYEPTNYVYCWEMGVKRWEWERVKEYFGVLSEYERAAQSGCNVKYGAEILREI